jgi:hypothetical protein
MEANWPDFKFTYQNITNLSKLVIQEKKIFY